MSAQNPNDRQQNTRARRAARRARRKDNSNFLPLIAGCTVAGCIILVLIVAGSHQESDSVVPSSTNPPPATTWPGSDRSERTTAGTEHSADINHLARPSAPETTSTREPSPGLGLLAETEKRSGTPHPSVPEPNWAEVEWALAVVQHIKAVKMQGDDNGLKEDLEMLKVAKVREAIQQEAASALKVITADETKSN